MAATLAAACQLATHVGRAPDRHVLGFKAIAEPLTALPSSQTGMRDPDCRELPVTVGYQTHYLRSESDAAQLQLVVDIISLLVESLDLA